MELAQTILNNMSMLTELELKSFNILNGSLNFLNPENNLDFEKTRQVEVSDINEAQNLVSLAVRYRNEFFHPLMTLRGSKSNSTATSTSESFKPKIERNKNVKIATRDRDNRCVLTGDEDIEVLEAAHIIPFSILNKEHAKSFISHLAPWLSFSFFSQIDSCHNTILLNAIAHTRLGEFKWFISTDDDTISDSTVYKANEPGNEKVLFKNGMVRMNHNGQYTSTANKALFIGTGVRPSKVYIKLHELICRMLHMRGKADDKEINLYLEGHAIERSYATFLNHEDDDEEQQILQMKLQRFLNYNK